jgi:hypothetical protein
MPAVIRALLGLALIVLGAAPAAALTTSWTNSAGGNWNTPGNWDNGVPGPADDARIVLSGTYTVTLDVDATVASLTLGGASGTQTLSATSRILTLDGASAVNSNGVLALVTSTVNGTGSLTNSGSLTLRPSTIDLPLDNLGSLTASTGVSAITGALTSGSGSTIVVGASVSSTGVLTVANGFTNNGTIDLTNNGGNTTLTSTLIVASGTLVNASGRSINSLAGSFGGPARTLTAQLDNQGTVNVAHPLTINGPSADHSNSGTLDVSGANLTITQSGTTPSLTNAGALTIASGRTLQLNGAGGDFAYNSGSTLSSTGTLILSATIVTLNIDLVTTGTVLADLRSSTVNGPGRVINSATTRLEAATVNVPLDNLGTTTTTATSAINGTFTSGSGSLLRIGASLSSSGLLTVADGFTNNGTIELTNNGGNSSLTATLNVTNGYLVNAVGRSINILAGSSGGPARALNAQLDNQGTLSAGTAVTINRAASDHLNSGTISVTGGNLTITQSGATPSFTNSGPITVAASRTMTLSGGSGAFVYDGGAVTGSGTLTILSSIATLNVDFSGPFVTNFNSATVNGPGKLINGNNMRFNGVTVNANMDNFGSLTSGSGTTNVNGTYTSMPFSQIIVAGEIGGAGTTTFANGFTSNGQIQMISFSNPNTATLNVTNGTLTIAPGRVINTLVGAGGARNLNAQLDNQGTIYLETTTLTINKASADHVSSGAIDVSGGNLTITQSGTTPTFVNSGVITISSGRSLIATSGGASAFVNAPAGTIRGTGTLNVGSSTFANNGTISPGVSPGILNVTGSAPFSGTGALDIEIAGTTVGTQYDQLSLSGVVTLDGTLNVFFPPGFCTGVGDNFRVVQAGGGRTGTFDTINITGHGNPVLNTQYDGTGLTLSTVSNNLTITASAGAGGAIGPTGAVLVACGDDQTFTITPDSCHVVADVLVDNVSVGPVTSYAFNDVIDDHTIAVTFAPATRTITASAGAGGAIDPTGAVVVDCGNDQSFTITPDPSFAIDDVLVDNVSVGPVANYTFNDVGANHTIAATFIATNEVGPVAPPGSCHLSSAEPDIVVPVVFERTDNSEALAASVTISLSPNLQLFGGTLASIEQGTWLSEFPSTFQAIDEGGGVYTVDQAILGGANCGVTTGGTLFTLRIERAPAAPDGSGTISVTAVDVRSCTNQPLPGDPGDEAEIALDYTAPAAITNLVSTQVKAGNGTSGRTGIRLTWTDPTAPDLDRVRIYRRGFGQYPEYDDQGGAAPPAPADSTAANAGWVEVSANAVSPLVDVPPTRDFYYYVAYSFDDCGNYSLVSNLAVDGTRTSSDPVSGTLDYILGDFASGGDNQVGLVDLSALADAYGRQDGQPLYNANFDIGPTSDGTVDGLPETDNRIQFQDLLIFAFTFGSYQVAPPEALLAADEVNGRTALALRMEPLPNGEFRVQLVLSGNPGTLKGVHAILEHPGAEVVRVARGSLLDRQAGELFFTHLLSEEIEVGGREQGVGVHTAILGDGLAIHGQGEVASIVFRGRPDGVELALADLRDLRNQPLGEPLQTAVLPETVVPLTSELLAAQPNPFNPQTTIRFRLASAEHTTLRIYDVTGQLVRTLVDERLEAGEHAAPWNGRSEDGASQSSGVYFTVLRAGSFAAREKLILMK